MGLWNIFAREGCICMREPYGSLVEFISRYNSGGGFWWDHWEGFQSLQVEQCLTYHTMAWDHGGVDKDRRLLGKFPRG